MLMKDLLSDLSMEEILDIYGISELPDDPESLEPEEEDEAVKNENLRYFSEIMEEHRTAAKKKTQP